MERSEVRVSYTTVALELVALQFANHKRYDYSLRHSLPAKYITLLQLKLNSRK